MTGRRLLAAFSVAGEAKGAGSKRAFKHPHSDRIIVTDDTGAAGRRWRADVQAQALGHFDEPCEGPIEIELVFFRSRPRSHFRTGRNANALKASAPAYPTTRPDVDKLSRAVLDALTKIAWRDDAQVVTKLAAKRYARVDRLDVRIYATELAAPAVLPADAEQLSLGGSDDYHCDQEEHGDTTDIQAGAIAV